MAAKDKENDPFDLAAGVPPIEGTVRPQPKFADRISRRVLMVVGGVALLMFVLFFAALDAMEKRQIERKEAKQSAATKPAGKPAETVAPKELLDGGETAPRGTLAPSLVTASQDPGAELEALLGNEGRNASLPSPSGRQAATPTPAAPTAVPRIGAAAPAGALGQERPLDDGLSAGAMQADARPVVKTLTPEQQMAERAKTERLKRMQDARSGGLLVASYSGEDRKDGAAGLPGSAAANAFLQSLQAQAGASGAPGGMQGQLVAAAQRGVDSEQEQKAQFIKNAGKDDRGGYLQSAQTQAVSPNEVKRGSYIPLRLEVAINSGQPGMVKARVTEDVYDTITGCRLLIPAMTAVHGAYDSRVAMGQTRNLVVWNHMGFEDGSELNLGGMQGYDSSGAAGIEADVDNHYGRMFGLAFGMSLVTAGVQQSVSTPPPNSNGMSTQQAIANSLAQQYGQLGAQILGKQMQVQPTLRNFPGERFVIMTPSTIVFKKVWRNRCQ